MKIFSAHQVKEWDAYTISHEPISSLALMERAGQACTSWLLAQHFLHTSATLFYIFCGPGNNGADGLVIARLLQQAGKTVAVFALQSSGNYSGEFEANLSALQEHSIPVNWLNTDADFPVMENDAVVIDALFGTGLNRVLEGLAAALVTFLHKEMHTIVSIDLPSGLFADKTSVSHPVVQANFTLSFGTAKLAFFMAENGASIGKVVLLDIGLLQTFLEDVQTQYHTFELADATMIYQPRKPNTHKGNFGHALIIAGSQGKMGAAVLATKAALRAGAGLVTVHTIPEGNDILQITAPEAMTSSGNIPDLSAFSAIAAGPGLGTGSTAISWLSSILQYFKQNKPAHTPLILDADALNLLAQNTKLLQQLPPQTILTPHPKEFERLFGTSKNDFERLSLAISKAAQLQCYIILKGHHSATITPAGEVFFNTTGNAGMAKGGTGDSLTGLLAGFAAQAYAADQVAKMGVYMHGLAGDFAAEAFSQEAMLATDLIESLPAAFKKLQQQKQF